jgi:hypothetical protein
MFIIYTAGQTLIPLLIYALPSPQEVFVSPQSPTQKYLAKARLLKFGNTYKSKDITTSINYLSYNGNTEN